MWQVREMIALFMLAICTDTDIRMRRIYLVPLFICALGGIIIGSRSNMYVIMTACFAASLYAALVKIKGKRRFVKSIPFAPFVMTGLMVMMINEI